MRKEFKILVGFLFSLFILSIPAGVFAGCGDSYDPPILPSGNTVVKQNNTRSVLNVLPDNTQVVVEVVAEDGIVVYRTVTTIGKSYYLLLDTAAWEEGTYTVLVKLNNHVVKQSYIRVN